MVTLGDYYLSCGNLDEAAPLFRDALDGCRAALDRNSETTQLALIGLAGVYSSKRNLVELEPVLKESRQIALATYGPNSANTANANSSLAALYFYWKEYAKAEPYYRDYKVYLLKTAPDSWGRFATEGWLGACLLERKEYAEAERLLQSAYDGMNGCEKGAPGDKQPELRNALEQIVRLYHEWGKKDQAEEWKARLDDLVFPAKPFAPPAEPAPTLVK